MRTRILLALGSALVVLALFLTAALTVSAGPAPVVRSHSAAPKHVVAVKSNSSATPYYFSPKTIKVKVGSSITWINKSGVGHTVTSNIRGKFSKNLSHNGRVTIKFKKTGTFKYHCLIHSWMKAEVIVHK